jgi:hypothetical protein
MSLTVTRVYRFSGCRDLGHGEVLRGPPGRLGGDHRPDEGNDAIVVPEDYAPVSWVRELKDWSQIFYQFGLGVAAIRILR